MKGDAVSDFEDKGWAVFDQFLNEPVAAEVDGLFADMPGGESDLRIRGNEVFSEAGELLFYLAAQPRVLDLLEAVIGPFVQLDSFAVVEQPSGADRGISWHRDLLGGLPRSTAFEVPRCVNLLIYLQDLTSDVGPLRVIPGSHRAPTLMSENQRSHAHEDELILGLRRGDAVLLHNNLLHSRSANRSGRPRRHLSIIYNHTWMRSSLEFRDEATTNLRTEILATGDPRLARLVGVDSNLSHRINIGFLGPDRDIWQEWCAKERSTLSHSDRDSSGPKQPS